MTDLSSADRLHQGAKQCGHLHDCACGLNLPLAHRDPNYPRQGFCAMPCAYCDALDASEGRTWQITTVISQPTS